MHVPLSSKFHYRFVIGVGLLALAALGTRVHLRADQGMGRTTGVARPVKPIETDLPPISVDFRDVAESAGLTAIDVSGGAEAKKYILETTGSGVALFDADNDG